MRSSAYIASRIIGNATFLYYVSYCIVESTKLVIIVLLETWPPED